MKQTKIQLLWFNWKKLSRKAAAFQGRVILTFLYFTLLVPIGIFFWLTKKTKKLNSTWEEKEDTDYQTLEGLKRQ